jgi:hypothetical protein
MNRKQLQIFALAFASLVGATVYSCKKTKETVAEVTVLNDSGSPVPGATVRLYGKPSPGSTNLNPIRFDTLGTTNGSGKVTFNFSDFYKKGQAGFAVLDIQVCKGTLAGTGIIKIQEETTNEESVTVATGTCLIPSN